MPRIIEGTLTFDFPNGWIAEKYDRWVFYVNSFQNVCGGAKGMDILAVNPGHCCWLIEIKDYRLGCQTNAADLANVVAEKVRDTLAGLAIARIRASGSEKQAADAGFNAPDIRIVLHMEQPLANSPLFPSPISRANVLQRLKQLIRTIDPGLRVVDVQGSQNLPWTVA